MAHSDSRRLSTVIPHLYPNLVGGIDKDYYLENLSDGNGTQLRWLTQAVTQPTDEEIAAAKEPACNAEWWRVLRKRRTENLFKSDWSQGEDIPSSIKTEYATYREKLRDLPSTVIKPSYETLSAQESICDGINDLMPTKPS